MKRDMDLVRTILIEIEKADGPVSADHFIDSQHSEKQVAYHVEMLYDRKLVDANLAIDKFYNVYQCEIISLTWDGSDYLDAIRDDTVWERTKEAVKKAVGSTTMDIFKETAKLIAMGAIKAQIRMM